MSVKEIIESLSPLSGASLPHDRLQALLDEHRQRGRLSLEQAMASLATQVPRLHVCGLNHVRADLHLREQYALDPAGTAALTRRLAATGTCEGVLVLSTCNRTEVYAYSAQPGFGRTLREVFLSLGHRSGSPARSAPIFEYKGQEAVRHLFAVVCGLDSQILGENQIKQQLMQAYELCQAHQPASALMRAAVEAAVRAGKRVRTETGLNEGSLDAGKVAVLKGEQVLGTLTARRCLLLGAGKIGRVAARAIAERCPERLWIVNRTAQRARELAEPLGPVATAAGLDELSGLLAQADFVLGAAWAPEFLVQRQRYETLAGRPGLVCMVDAALPRVLDPALSEVNGVQLFNFDHMEEIIEANRQRRGGEARRAWELVEQQVEVFRRENFKLHLTPLIRHLREQFRAQLELEQTRMAPAVESFTPEQQRALTQLKQRMLHKVTQHIKDMIRQSEE